MRGAPGDVMTELFITRKNDQSRMSSDADTDSKILLASGRSSPGLEVLNVPTQGYKCRISDTNGSDFLK